MDEKNKKAAWADCCEDWGGYMAAKKAKLEEQFQEAAQSEFSDASSLFRGIAIFVNGYTNPTSDELKRIMMAHGGVYHHYLRPRGTTHMIASNLPYSKIVEYRKAKNPLPLCKPEWITDSIKAGKILDYRKYLLYTQCTKNQPAIFAQVINQNRLPTKEPTQTSTSSSNSIISNITKSIESQALPLPKKSEIKLNATEKPEISSAIVNCTKNPEFLTEFYNNSRLHHISTMGAMFKDYVNELRDKSDGKFSGLEALKKQSYARFSRAGSSSRIDDSDSDDDLFNNNQYEVNRISPTTGKKQIIMHIDMDCFFVSVGLRKHPELKGFPVAVAHAKGNKQTSTDDSNEIGSMSEVASCSYEARAAGVKNGMFLGQALKLCPNLKTIRYDFEGYKEVSYALYDTVASYTLDIEAVSCDEMYADCTKILHPSGLTPMEFASIIRKEIKEKTGCPVSTGFGQNKLQARLATKKAKPDGQQYLIGDGVKTFIRTLKVRDLPGVGYSTSSKLQQINVKTCADLEVKSLYELQKEFGKKQGQQLHDMCRGIDHNKLNLEHIRKSVSAEVNYGIRFDSNEAAHEFLKKLSEEVSDRLKKIDSRGKCVTLKVMFRSKEAPEPRKFMGHGICDAFNKSKNLIALTDDSVIIAREVISLWNQLNQKPEDARGIGIQITKLESSKSKPTGSTLLKFIDRVKVQEKNEIIVNEDTRKEHDSLESGKMNLNRDQSENKSELTNKNVNLPDENDITLSLENQLISEEMQFDCDNLQGKNDEVHSLNNDSDLISNDVNKCSLKLDNQDNFEGIPNDNINVNNETSRDREIDKSTMERSSTHSSQLKQTKQSQYFKQTKPSSANRSGKAKLPDIQEIDMKVLIELPEDVRNEILNAYKENKNDETDFKAEESTSKNVDNRNTSSSTNMLEKNLSFSQIDPDFLAALPDEVKNEVKTYCDAQKKVKNAPVEGKRINNIAHRGWNMFKNETKPQNSTKLKPGKLKIVKGGGKREKKTNGKSNNKAIKEIQIIPSKNKIQEPENDIQNQVNENTSAANQSIYFDNSNGDSEHTEILSNLVKCLLDLPIFQVKLQMMQWISNSTDVNDVDFLSLTTYLGTLPRKRRLVDLHILLKCLHRCIKRCESCMWHETYRKMVKHVQIRMRSEYGHNLMIPQEIECDKCKIVTK